MCLKQSLKNISRVYQKIMSLTILNKKFDKVDEKEKVLRMTYDVRGANKHQHRFIDDLKEDFKEEFLAKHA